MARAAIVGGFLLPGLLIAQTFVARPYIQPGDGSTVGGHDVKTIAWVTDNVAASYRVELFLHDKLLFAGSPTIVPIEFSTGQVYLAYSVILTDLPLNSELDYKVSQGGKVVSANTFRTRRSPGCRVRFVVAGDLGENTAAQKAVAYRMARENPDLAILCGDIVYNRGRFSEYVAKFWPVYCNAPTADPSIGAPIMQSVPFYVALGNHDSQKADLAGMPDAFAAFYFFHPPLNAPAYGPWTTPIIGPEASVRAFKASATKAGYPHLSLYSFEDGDCHFLVLDSNDYLPVLNNELRAWIRRDLNGTAARWKMVFCHHPGFSSAAKHHEDQRMRLLSPLFEECGVDLYFAGHVHNYQRTKPLLFSPADPAPPPPVTEVRGRFRVDEKFDGKERTEAEGIIYFVTGGGGGTLYRMESKESPPMMPRDPDAPDGILARYVDNVRSFTLVEADAGRVLIRQIGEDGAELDRILLTKPGRAAR